MEERLAKHLSNHDGFTAKAKDWQIVFNEHFEQYEQALEKEKLIKSWKSRRKIEKLILIINFDYRIYSLAKHDYELPVQNQRRTHKRGR